MPEQPIYNSHPDFSPVQPGRTQRTMKKSKVKSKTLQKLKDWSLLVSGSHNLQSSWTMPAWLNDRATWLYTFALVVVTILYFSYSLPWYYLLAGVVSVFVFFVYGRHLSQTLSFRHISSSQAFEKKIFSIAFLLRLAWTLLIYIVFMKTYGNAFGYDNADATYYDKVGNFVAGLIDDGNFHFYDEVYAFSGADLSDMGYGIYLGIVYYLADFGIFQNEILVSRVLKCIWSAYTVVLIYRLAFRNFGPKVARMAAVFCALWPNFWYYCGAHLKEVEMVFLTVLFVEQADQMLRSRQFTLWKLVPLLLIISALFTIRTPLALVAILALLFSVVMSSSRVVTWGKRVAVGVAAIALVAVTMGNRIQENVQQLVQTQQAFQQQGNMEWRATRKDSAGNVQKFAKYAGAAVFAPLIFTIPFPTMVCADQDQHVQQLLNGGNYIKNLLSVLTILSMFVMLFSGSWRDHLIPVSFLLGYLVVLTMSNFAHSERFHQPVMPLEMMFAAYGLSIVMSNKKYQKWLGIWFVFVFAVAVFWNWFKLAGRGLV